MSCASQTTSLCTHEVPRRIFVGCRIRRRDEQDFQRRSNVLSARTSSLSSLRGDKIKNAASLGERRFDDGRRSVDLLHDVHLRPLATAARSFRGLLATLDRGLHVVPAPLELTEDSLSGHLPLEVLDRALDSFVTHGDFERFALYGVGRHF